MVVLARYRVPSGLDASVEYEKDDEIVRIPLSEVRLLKSFIPPRKIINDSPSPEHRPDEINEVMEVAREAGGDYVIKSVWGTYFILANIAKEK